MNVKKPYSMPVALITASALYLFLLTIEIKFIYQMTPIRVFVPIVSDKMLIGFIAAIVMAPACIAARASFLAGRSQSMGSLATQNLTRFISAILAIAGLLGYVLCMKHVCMCGHAQHGLSTYQGVNDIGWIFAFQAAIVLCFYSNMRLHRWLIGAILLLMYSRINMGSAGGANFLFELPLAGFVLFISVMAFFRGHVPLSERVCEVCEEILSNLVDRRESGGVLPESIHELNSSNHILEQ